MADHSKAEDRLFDIGHDDIKLLDGYESALIGVDTEGRAIYDYDLMVQWLMEEESMDFDTAVLWMEQNTIAAIPYMGEGYPIVMQRLSDVSIEPVPDV